MKKDQQAAKTAKRREFLKLAGLGTLTGAAAAVSGRTVRAEVADSDRTGGYRETAHVKKVYELSRF